MIACLNSLNLSLLIFRFCLIGCGIAVLILALGDSLSFDCHCYRFGDGLSLAVGYAVNHLIRSGPGCINLTGEDFNPVCQITVFCVRSRCICQSVKRISNGQSYVFRCNFRFMVLRRGGGNHTNGNADFDGLIISAVCRHKICPKYL